MITEGLNFVLTAAASGVIGGFAWQHTGARFSTSEAAPNSAIGNQLIVQQTIVRVDIERSEANTSDDGTTAAVFGLVVLGLAGMLGAWARSRGYTEVRDAALGAHLGMARRLDGLLFGTSFYAISHGCECCCCCCFLFVARLAEIQESVWSRRNETRRRCSRWLW